AACPSAVVQPPLGPVGDFATVRRARNIVVSVSTFAWLAAWLSEATRIHLPVYGIFNPEQFRQIDLLPLADQRYIYYRFPVHWAVPLPSLSASFVELGRSWRIASPRELVRYP
ncbi:MAG: hypothetical protein JWQ36_118, partial [Enterovirga sp.]|nr:hypothetical protein [Enterovirga sp.]